jgi:divalent metal cation (Fe/Co/Zn/Cd) transporter
VRLLATRHDLSAHGIRIYEERGQRWLELHLEVNESLTLDEAHRKSTDFEAALREAIPGLERIVTHIEPAGDSTSTIRAEPVGEKKIRQILEQFRLDHRMIFDPHDLHVQQIGGELAVSLHCTLAPATSISDAHEFTVRLEDYLRGRVKRLGRVVIHVEPQEDRG